MTISFLRFLKTFLNMIHFDQFHCLINNEYTPLFFFKCLRCWRNVIHLIEQIELLQAYLHPFYIVRVYIGRPLQKKKANRTQINM